MSMQKSIVDCVRTHGGDFVIELKANQRSFRYMVEDRLKWLTPVYEYTEGPELATAGLKPGRTAYMTAWV